jgi:acetylornithine/N-succinyldiaminopimelate aminotransferase|tara:strand:+ start:61240 stop:62445 length:1206 start_codon:yes stop_codon:yes gene_type:complete
VVFYLIEVMMSSSVANTYNRNPITFESGKGIYLYTESGERYYDLASGIAVNAVGHSNKHLIDKLIEQANKLWHVSNLYRIPEQELLANRLTDLSFADKVFFCNSGAEAVEASIKAARKYHFSLGDKDKTRIITFQGAFHGRTLGTISAANNPNHLEGFGTPLEGFDSIPIHNIELLKEIIGDTTAAILIEPIQGEGGIRVIDNDFLKELRKITKDNNLLLILDEVQCGMGRTGKLFAHEWANVRPDIMAVAKGIGGGFPMGACLMTEEASRGLIPGTHGSTFGGNPLGMAVGNAVLDIIQERNFLEKVNINSSLFHKNLKIICKDYPEIISSIRGKGLMIGLECNIKNTVLSDELFKNKILSVGAGENVLRLLPPLTINEKEILEVTKIISKCCENIKNKK